MRNEKNQTEKKPLLQFSFSTLLTIISLLVGIASAAYGFGKAGDSRVAPAVISALLFISGIAFAVQFVNGIRTQSRWQRIIAVISALVAVFVVVMAIVFYQALSQVQMPTY